MAFNHINKYSLLTFFLWNMLAVSSVLVTLQFQLVEYKLNEFFQKTQTENLMLTGVCLFFPLLYSKVG